MGIIGAKHGLTSRGGYNVELQLDGDWIGFRNLVNSVDVKVSLAAREAQRLFAEKYLDTVKDNIRSGGKKFGYPETKPDYTLRKIRYGGGTTTLRWSDSMLESVTIVRGSRGTNWSVGIPAGLERPKYYPSDKNRLTISEYANILEHGRPPYMPARPVFSDSFRRIDGGVGGLRGMKLFLETTIILKLRALGIKTSKLWSS